MSYLSIHQLKIHCKGHMNDKLLVQRQTKPRFNGIIKGSFSTDHNGKVQVQIGQLHLLIYSPVKDSL